MDIPPRERRLLVGLQCHEKFAGVPSIVTIHGTSDGAANLLGLLQVLNTLRQLEALRSEILLHRIDHVQRDWFVETRSHNTTFDFL